MKNFLLFLTFIALPALMWAQEAPDSIPVYEFGEPVDFEVGGIKVIGATFSDENAVIGVSGLKVGDKIRVPGPDIPKAMRALWRLRLFSDVQIVKEKTIGDVIFLEIIVTERPRFSRHSYDGVKKSYHDDLNTEVNKYLLKGGIVTEDVKVNAEKAIEKYYIEKGYFDIRVQAIELPDTARANSMRIVFKADRGARVKIEDILFTGNDAVPAKKLRRKMKETKRKGRLFASSKFIKQEYETDKENIIKYYNTIGHRDAIILGDTMWRTDKGHLMVRIDLQEGNRYYIRNIVWKGNSIYPTETLATVLGIEKGEIYNQELLEQRLRFSQEGRDVSTLYMDNGYLFFNVDPVEVAIFGDSIDLEMRIFEGPQATIDRVTINGNDRTHEHVVRRELRTKPGAKFSRTDIIRSQREIINLGYFNPEALGINTPVNPQRGTVDIEYTVEEKPSDQLELSAGWGGFQGVIGTLGVSFNNFSMRNFFKKSAWRPVPQGDGQRLSIRAQSNGRFFQSYNASFTEPWLGGKKPTSLTVSAFYNRLTTGSRLFNTNFGSFDIINGSVGIGTRLNWPDDNFISNTAVSFQVLNLNNWQGGLFRDNDGNRVTEGTYNNFSIRQTFARSTINEPIFPREGSRISLAIQATLPYSLFNNKNYEDLPPQERYQWLEYHKWRFDAEWYSPVVGKLVFKASAKIGVLGAYSKRVGVIPFERSQLGGDGINNQQFAFNGLDIVSLRGYDVQELENNLDANGGTEATPIFNKFTVELRYPLSLNPSSTIYVLAFAQGGNAYKRLSDYNPLDLKRSTGLGLRVFLPMFGVLGFDYGLGFDKENDGTLQSLGRFNIILGFEPD